MITPKVAFIVYGVHKDGLQDPMGTPFIDDKLIEQSKQAIRASGIELVVHDTIIASKSEAKKCFSKYKNMADIDAVILFSGTWVWAAHLIGAIRDFSFSNKGIVVWTHPGSQGWRPVGGLVMQAALKEVGIRHRFVYGAHDCDSDLARIVSWCRASHMVNNLNMSTCGVFGGRGMGQTCGAADPSQWMKMFGIDIDSRDTTELIKTADAVSEAEISEARTLIQPLFSEPIPSGVTADKSIRLYLAIKKILKKENWDFYTIQSFPGLGDTYSATCFAQSMILNDRIATSTLSDFNTCLAVKLLNDFSQDPIYYGDLQHIDKANNEIKIIGDGACPPSLAGKLLPAKFAEHGIPTEGEAGGISVELVCKPGSGILARLGRNNGNFEMALVRCQITEPDSLAELEKRRLECGIPFWPHAFVTVDGDIESLLQAWNNEYAILGYGTHLYQDMLDFCEQTGITATAL